MRPIVKNVLLILSCAALVLLLGGMLYYHQEKEAAETARLEELASRAEDKEKTPRKADGQKEQTPPEEETKAQEEEESAPGIACWGDELLNEAAEAASYSYIAVLQRLLSEQGYDLPVVNKTLTGTSSLTIMKMAGVPEEEIEGYIAAHRQAAGGAELPITEGSTRELTPEQLTREDKDYIPVLFMGFYGGWNYNPAELIEHQKKVLDTFGKYKDSFLIVGLAPTDGSVELAAYDSTMKAAWGEHYISCQEVNQSYATTHEGQEEIGRAIFNKLAELQYITKADTE